MGYENKLGPDIDHTKFIMNGSLDSVSAITHYALTIRALDINPVLLNYDLAQPLQASIDRVKRHADVWLNTLMPEVMVSFPEVVKSFSKKFESKSASLIKLNNTILKNGHGPATQVQKDKATKRIAYLLTEIEEQLTQQKKIRLELDSFNELLQEDQALLTSESIDMKHTQGEELTGPKFLQGKVTGVKYDISNGQAKLKRMWLLQPMTQVSISDHVSELKLKLTGLNAHLSKEQAESIRLLMLSHTFRDLKNSNLNTRSIYSSVIEAWEVLKQKYNSVLKSLEDSTMDELGTILLELDIETAQLGWQQLADFVSGLQAKGEQHGV